MAADTMAQEWIMYVAADSTAVLTGTFTTTTDPTAYTLTFTVTDYQGGTALLTIPNASITHASTGGSGAWTGTFTIPFTAAQLTTTLPSGRYHGVLRRTDSGSAKPLAAGALTVLTP